ncbi:PAS domain S-box protein [Planctomicrobium sp. SH668]|uniref:PAS domain S-box protein n=1 Tax=Planctomicrobium sp. SH668 TaxID=3448126 RepID=UPI003F5B11C5
MQEAAVITEKLLQRWNGLLQTLQQCLGAGCCQIVRLVHAREIEVVTSVGDRNSMLEFADYLQEVIDTPSTLEPLPNADSNSGYSYYGTPIFNPDTTVFGALEFSFPTNTPLTDLQRSLVVQFRSSLEDQLILAIDYDSSLIGTLSSMHESQEELRISEERCRLLVENAGDDYFVHDVDGQLLDVNSSACHNLGYTREELLQLRVSDLSKDLTLEEKRRLWREMPVGETVTVSAHHRCKSGKFIPVEVRVSCHFNRGKKIFLGLARDMTQKFLAEQALHQLNLELERRVIERTTELQNTGSLLQAVMDGATDAIYLKDAEGRFQLFNRASEKQTGKTAMEVLGKTAREIYGNDVGRKIERHERYVIANGEAVTWEEPREIGDETRTFLITQSPRRDRNGNVIGLIGISRDITDRKRAEVELRVQQERLVAAEKLSKVGSWTLDVKTGDLACSKVLLDMAGINPIGGKLTVPDLQSMFDDEGYRQITESVDRCTKTGEPYEIEALQKRADGTSFFAHIRGQANFDSAGNVASISGTVQDVTEREESKRRLETLADNLPRGAICRLEFDQEFKPHVVYVSRGIADLIGVPYEVIKHRNDYLIDLIHPDDLLPLRHAIRKGIESRSLIHIELRIRRQGGNIRWLEMRVIPSLVHSDGAIVWDGIFNDITESRLAAAEMQKAKEAAESAERAKSDFLATMSHEIRTPMNTVIGMTRLTLQTDLNPKQRNYLEKIDGSAKNLLGIINDILDFSKIEAGQLQLEDTEFTLESVLDTVTATTVPRAEEKELEVVYQIDPSVPPVLRGDPLRFSQILINLIGNAIKFTATGEISIEIRRQKTHGNVVTLAASVRDTGIGIHPDVLGGLFNPFTQADSKISRRYGGTGLGLSICKRLVEKMNGTIRAESEVGVGSVFHFTIDMKLAGHTVKRFSLPAIRGKRVLVVDDSQIAREALTDIVVSFGMAAKCASSGFEAIQALRDASASGAPYDIVLMDWRMPEMDGIETTHRIRSDAEVKDTPAVLMVTAFAREDIRSQIEQLPLQGLLIKPVTESMMFNAIQEIFVPQNQSTAKLYNSLSPSRNSNSQAMGDQRLLQLLEGKRVLVVDDNALNREVARDFLEVVKIEVQTVASGEDAIQRLELQDFDAVLMDMHMPKMDGLETTQKIRLNPRWANLPIVALTAQARTEDRESSLRAGMYAHLTKPINETLLYQTLAKIFSGFRPGPYQPDKHNLKPIQAAAETNAPSILRPSNLNEDVREFDYDRTLRRFGSNRDRVDRLLRGFIRDFGSIPEFISDGSERLPSEVLAAAHMVKGAAGYLDCNSLVETAEALEQAAKIHDLDKMKLETPRFCKKLLAVLEEIEEALLNHSPATIVRSTLATGESEEKLRELLNRAEDLIASGDYSANQLLKELADALAGHETAHYVEEIRTHFEDLELELARSRLTQLKQAIEGTLRKQASS